MFYARSAALLAGVLALTGGVVGDDKKEGKKDEPAAKVKGQLPTYWGQIGLTDEQKQKVYKIQGKYAVDIDKLKAQIKELEEKMRQERLEVLNPDQKKKLEDVIKSKAGGEKK